MMVHCADCGRVFDQQAHRDGHLCSDMIEPNTARSMRASIIGWVTSASHVGMSLTRADEG